MFIYLENLLKVEDVKEELYLIPQPRYFKIADSFRQRINENSKIITDLPDNTIIEVLQVELLAFGLKKGLEINQFKNIKKASQVDTFLEEKLALFPKNLYDTILMKQIYEDQGYLLISSDSKLIIKANSFQGLYYGVQTLIQTIYK